MYKCSRYICWLPKEPMFGVTEADMGGHRRVFKRTVIYTDVSTREIQSHVIVQGTCRYMYMHDKAILWMFYMHNHHHLRRCQGWW